jgi:hypothetical protein
MDRSNLWIQAFSPCRASQATTPTCPHVFERLTYVFGFGLAASKIAWDLFNSSLNYLSL